MRLRAPTATFTASFAAMLFLWVAGAQGAPASRAEAFALWQAVAAATEVEADWTGSTERCEVGAESDASQAATLTAVNALRSQAGLSPVTLDATRNRQALAAAMLMAANGDLDHSPPRSWRCWSEEAAAGAGASNLYLGRSGASAMVGYVFDSGVESLGHRNWLLDPRAVSFGTGSTGGSNALHVVGQEQPSDPPPAFVAWPPPGHIVWDLIGGEWSIEFFGSQDLDAAQVALAVDGQPAQPQATRLVSSHQLAFSPELGEAYEGDHTISIVVSGIWADGMAQSPISYEVLVANIDPPKITRLRYLRERRLVPGGLLRLEPQILRAVSVSYQWLRGGQAIAGATAPEYRLVRADRGRRIRCRLVALGPEGQRTTARTYPLAVPKRPRSTRGA